MQGASYLGLAFCFVDGKGGVMLVNASDGGVCICFDLSLEVPLIDCDKRKKEEECLEVR